VSAATERPVLDRDDLELELADDFTGPALDPQRWLAHYLPQWTTPERSAARYRLDGDGLQLLIEADQPAWLPEEDLFRVSHVQTGSFSGPMGSALGQHRHRDGLTVRTPQPTRRLWTPSSGAVEVSVRASPDPTCMLGIWLVGFEESPEQSGEICVAELFGSARRPHGSEVRLGIKAHHDPRLRTDVVDLTLDLDTSEEHTYAARWDAHRTLFYVDDRLVRTVEQGTDYPLQLMVDLFEFPTGDAGDAGADRDARDPAGYPKSALVRSVRGYRLAGRPPAPAQR
jgi:hypothetical protein